MKKDNDVSDNYGPKTIKELIEILTSVNKN